MEKAFPSVTVTVFPSGPFATNAYLVVCHKTNEAALIDASPGSAARIIPVIQAKDIALKQIILTHSHWDHIADVKAFMEICPAALLVHPEDAPNVTQPGVDAIPFWVEVAAAAPTHLVQEGDRVQIGQSEWQVLHTPGHSPGSICLYSPEEKILFSGDTLFKRNIGNLSLPTGQPERMWPSLEKLSRLPSDVTVFPGHGPSTSIGEEPWLANAKEHFG